MEADYFGEVENQWRATAKAWLKYLKYEGLSAGAKVYTPGSAFVTADGTSVPGHNTVFVTHSTIVYGLVSATKEPAGVTGRTAAQILDVVYPDDTVKGAHYSLELGGALAPTKPAVFRGGSSKYGDPGFARPADREAAKAFMTAERLVEEARVLGRIQDAIDAHMHPVAKLKEVGTKREQQRSPGSKPDHLS